MSGERVFDQRYWNIIFWNTMRVKDEQRLSNLCMQYFCVGANPQSQQVVSKGALQDVFYSDC